MNHLIKPNSTLGRKVINYINWRYNGTRSCCCIMVVDCMIKVITRCHKKDHYPTKLRNAYRRHCTHGVGESIPNERFVEFSKEYLK